jgi:hypothetical protein
MVRNGDVEFTIELGRYPEVRTFLPHMLVPENAKCLD